MPCDCATRSQERTKTCDSCDYFSTLFSNILNFWIKILMSLVEHSLKLNRVFVNFFDLVNWISLLLSPIYKTWEFPTLWVPYIFWLISFRVCSKSWPIFEYYTTLVMDYKTLCENMARSRMCEDYTTMFKFNLAHFIESYKALINKPMSRARFQRYHVKSASEVLDMV